MSTRRWLTFTTKADRTVIIDAAEIAAVLCDPDDTAVVFLRGVSAPFTLRDKYADVHAALTAEPAGEHVHDEDGCDGCLACSDPERYDDHTCIT